MLHTLNFRKVFSLIRALTRILKTGVPEPDLPKSGSTHHTKEYSPFQKIGVPAPKKGVQDCKSAVSESSALCCDSFFSADTRPGLVPKHIARRNELEKKEKASNQKNKQKPKAVIEKEKRNEGLSNALTSDNKGFSLLAKMGYKPGMAIGKSGKQF